MAVGIPAPNCVLIVTGGTIAATTRWANVFHAQYSGVGPTVANLQSMATTLTTAWSTNIAPMCSSNIVLTQMDLADLTNPQASAIKTTQNVVGTRTGTAFPAQVAAVVSWQINVRYRGGHPRTYYPAGVSTDQQNLFTFTAGFRTSMLAAANAWRTAINGLTHGGTTYQMVAVSFQTNNAPRAQGLPFTISSAVMHTRIDTQRRRLGKETG